MPFLTVAAGGPFFAHCSTSTLSYRPLVTPPYLRPLPWIQTSARRVNRALDALPLAFVQAWSALLVDLGSGDGVAVIAAAKRGMIAHRVGTGYSYSCGNFKASCMAKSAGGDRATFQLGNLFDHKVARYSVVMVYGVVPLMPRIAAES